MPRTFSELIGLMEGLTKGLPDAWKLTKRFKNRAVPYPWDTSTEFDPEADFRIDVEIQLSMPNPVFVIFLPEGARAPADDSLVWSRTVECGDDSVADALFVDAVPCHGDWLALKAVHAFGELEIDEMSREFAATVLRSLRVPDGPLAYHLTPAVTHLNTRLEVMIHKLMDRRLRGRILSRIKTLKRQMSAVYDEETVAQRLIRDIQKLLSYTWPESLNQEEHHARYELVRAVARGIVFHDFRDTGTLH